jgi:hydroxyethylthiazole kinase-like uncharacterized protein yjeF
VIEAFTAEDVRAAEQPLLAAERGFGGGLMHRAATALEVAVRGELRRRRGVVPGSVVVGLIGPGNNGGDTLHALARLARHGVRAIALLTAKPHDGGLTALVSARGRVVGLVADLPGEPPHPAVALCLGADVVLDGLLGIGGRGGLRGVAAELIAALSDGLSRAGAGAPLIIAVDSPSGIGVDDGGATGPVLRADRTVTFGVAKPGLLLPPAADLVGRLTVVDLGLRPVLADQARTPAVSRLTRGDVAGLWPVPGPTDHKYTRGVVGLVAGTAAYPGAAVLAAGGALGAGAGMVRHVGPDPARRAVLAAHPEVVTGSSVDVQVQAWVVGPGVGGDDEQAARARDALDNALEAGIPAVVDAGGLEVLPEQLAPHVVLTPHAGELSRLLGARGIDAGRAEIEAAPLRWAREAAAVTGATILLKGHTTVVVGHGEATADVVFAQRDAPAWLATAGAGDVLAGLLGALLAARTDEVRDGLAAELAAAATLVSGLAARAANPGGPLTAGGVARALPRTIAALLAGEPPRGAAPRIHIHRATRRVVSR